jgi:hypothetical protein
MRANDLRRSAQIANFTLPSRTCPLRRISGLSKLHRVVVKRCRVSTMPVTHKESVEALLMQTHGLSGH